MKIGDARERNDDLRAARGIVYAVLFGVAFWALFLWMVFRA